MGETDMFTIHHVKNFSHDKQTNLKPLQQSVFVLNEKKQQKMYFLTVYSSHVTYAFQSESTLHSCLDVKEPLGRRWREI